MNSPDTVPQDGCRAARSPEELFPLVDFCRAGRLKDVSEWIAAGKPLDPPQTAKKRSRRRQGPLDIAIEKGFFTLAEMLLEAGCDPLANGNALCDAVAHDEPEIAKLLLERGVPVDSVYPSGVFTAGRAMLELFIAHGLDPSAELAFYEALQEKVHPFLFILKEHKERFPDLQRQANMALCYHCEKNSPRNVGLLLWAGAQPDAEVPHSNYSDCTTTAVEMAARSGRVEVLKQLKPQNHPRLLQNIFPEIWLHCSLPMIDYLVSLGAPLNTKQNGGCELVDRLVSQIGFRCNGLYGNPNATEIKETLAAINHLCRLGAKWVPNADESLRNARDRIRKIEGHHLLELFRIFKETDATAIEVLDSMIASPALRKSLGAHLQSIEKLLHPPPPKPASEPRHRPADDMKAKPPPLTLVEVRSRAEALLLDLIRQEPSLHFRNDSTSESLDGKQLKKRLGVSKDDDRDLQPIIEAESKKLNGRLRCFQTNVESWSRSGCRLTATLKKTAEWPEALEEAWSFSDWPNESRLTDTAIALRTLIKAGGLGSDWIPERSITFKLGLYGREGLLADYFRELENKTAFKFKWEQEGERWGPHRYRIAPCDVIADKKILPGTNPKIDVLFEHCRKRDRDAVQNFIYEQLLKAELENDSLFLLVSISTRKELTECFPRFTSIESTAAFFHDLPLDKSLSLSFDFRENANWWFVGVRPKKDWKASLDAIKRYQSRPSLQEQYELSSDAAKLLTWIQELPDRCFTGRWTPVVEEAREEWIGISCPWAEENVPAYLQMLLDEINQLTEYQLTLQPWNQHGRLKSRIRVSRKRSDIEDLVKQVQLLALARGSLLESGLARDAIENLIMPQNPNAAE